MKNFTHACFSKTRFFFLLILLAIGFKSYATVWTTTGPGAVTTLANWSNGVGAPGSFTTPGDKWIIAHAMTMSSSSASWVVGAASGAPDTVIFSSGGTVSMSGAGTTFTITIYGDANFTGGTLSLGGAGTTCNANINGNVDMASGTISSVASSTDLFLNIFGSFTNSGGTVTTTGASSTITQNSHGTFKMSAGNYNAGGASGVITTNIYSDCAITGTAVMTNTGAGCTNTVHLALHRSAGTMSVYNTSTGTWSGTNIFVDTNCIAQLAGNFSTTTGSASFGLTVNGTLMCPAAYTVNGTRKFTLNGVGSLIVAHPTGINGAIVTTGTKTFSNSANYGFNGTAAQVTGSDMPAALVAPDTITISNPMGVTLSQATATTGKLLFTNGILHTGTYTMTVPGGSTSVSGAGLTNYVEGTFIKTATGLSSVNFEVGDTSYAPMLLTFDAAATAGSVGMKVTNGLHPNIATSGITASYITTHYWTATNMGLTGPDTVTPKATYNLSTIISGSNNYFRTQMYSGSAWLSAARKSTNTSAPYTTVADTGFALASFAGDYIFGRVNVPSLNAPSLSKGGEVTVFPNPNKGTFTLLMNSATEEDLQVLITDILGRKIKEFSIVPNKITTVELGVATGVYLLSVKGISETHSGRIVVE